MKLNVIKNAKRNIVFGFLNKILVVFCPFVTRTVIQYVLGKEYLGLSSLFFSILSVLSLAELGFGSAVVFSMYKPIAEDDTGLVNALLNFYKRVYFCIGCVISIIGFVLMPFLKYLIKGSYPSDINIYVLYIAYLLNTVLSYFLFSYKISLLVVYQRDDINSRINMIVTFLMTMTQVLILLKFHSYLMFVFMMPFFTVINNLYISYAVKKLYPQYYCEGVIPNSVLSVLKKQIIGTFVSKVCIVARNSFDSICISAFIGLSMTAIYDNYYLIINAIGIFLGVITSSFTGGVGNHVTTRSVKENFNELEELDFLYMWISGWCTVCLLCLFQPFMQLWMGKEMMLSHGVVILLCIYFYLLRLGDMRSIYVLVNGLWWQQRYRSIFEAICNIFLNIILARFYGIYGIIFATIITLLFIHTVWSSWIVFENYFGKKYFKAYFIYQLKYAFVTVIICTLSSIICGFVNIGNILGVIIRGLICLIFSNGLYFLIYRRNEKFKRVVKRLVNR